jgi:hypothetical protein
MAGGALAGVLDAVSPNAKDERFEGCEGLFAT